MGAASEIILGIDLGTTYSTAAAVIDGKVHLVLDGRGEPCVPSVVHFPKSGPVLVGAEADRLRATDLPNTVFGIKRLIGRDAASSAARLLDACSALRIQGPPGQEASVEVRTGRHTASEIAAYLLRHLRERAEARFGRRISKAVLTVPATAPPPVREAMVRCGRLAGLEVLQVVPEPCAGAVAHGLRAAGSGAPLLVYDFGGGTFDATVMQPAGQRLRVLASGGDECLGGDDLDEAFARFVASGVYRTHGVDVTRDVILWDRIRCRCELVKRALSAGLEARFLVKDAWGSGERARHLDYLFRREHVAPHWAELVQRSLDAASAVVARSGIAPDDLGEILLIGGTTFVPQVRARVAESFACRSTVEEDPQTAVARGAALVAARAALLAA